MNEELRKETENILKSTNIIFILSLLIMAVSLVIASVSIYYYKLDEDNKIAMLEQNEELRIENQRLVDKSNDVIKRHEILNNTLLNIKYEQAFLQALVNTTFNYETGYGESVLWKEYNNAGGIKGYYSGEYLSYESKTHGLTHLESLLQEEYINVHGHDVIAIRKAYDPNYTEEQLNEFINIFKTEFEKTMNGDY